MSFHSMKGCAFRRPTVSKFLSGSALSVLLFSQPGFAETEHDTRHVDAHEHGAAELAIALDGAQLVAEFASPGMNLVGFEHQAKDPGEVAAVEAVVQQLRLGADLLNFVGGECALTKVDVKAEGLLAAGEHEDEHEDDHHDEHEDEHEDDHHDEHEDDHEDDHSDEHHADEGAHAEFEATYVFNCANADMLTSVSTSLFTTWPGIEEIETVFISADHQVSAELTASDPSFEIK